MPPPIILVHVSESGVDATLSGDGVGSSREKLRNTGGVESSLGETKGGTKTRATGTNHESVVLVVLFATCQY